MSKPRVYGKDVAVTDEREGLGVELDIGIHGLIVSRVCVATIKDGYWIDNWIY
jgi:hypothetical protein